MSSTLGDRAEARQMRTSVVATRVAKVERAVREHGDGTSTGGTMPAAPTRAGDDAAGGRDAAADDDAVVEAAAVAAAKVALEGGERDAQDAVCPLSVTGRATQSTRQRHGRTWGGLTADGASRGSAWYVWTALVCQARGEQRGRRVRARQASYRGPRLAFLSLLACCLVLSRWRAGTSSGWRV